MRKIAVITGSRADYGLLNPVIRCMAKERSLKLQLVVTGSHLSAAHGMTVREIYGDGFKIAGKVRLNLSSDTGAGVSRAIGEAVTGFAREYLRLKPDIIVVLGDRFEIFAAAAAAVPLGIPVAHLHGGETTKGAFDDKFRHAITKISMFHFPAANEYARMIIRMGEDPGKVFCTGSPAVDNIMSERLISRRELLKGLGIPEEAVTGIMTYHPVTLRKDYGIGDVDTVIAAIKNIKGIFWVITMPNSDPGNAAIRAKMEKFARQNRGSAKAFDSLGRVKYLSLMACSSVMVGNSSSGIIEAPSFGLPAVNIGDRQQGRIRGANVIDVANCKRDGVENAVRKALSAAFRRRAAGSGNPYGDGHAARRIVKVLKSVKLGPGLYK